MASINDLPIESITKIIDLSVEDSVARCLENYSRYDSDMLLNLALVSKHFTRPTQKVLWRYMNSDHLPFIDQVSLQNGFGKDKIIECFTIKDGANFDSAGKAFLRNVKEVLELRVSTMIGSIETPRFVLLNLSSVPSLTKLRSLTSDGRTVVFLPNDLLNLHHFSCKNEHTSIKVIPAKREKDVDGKNIPRDKSRTPPIFTLQRLINSNTNITSLSLVDIRYITETVKPDFTRLLVNLQCLSLKYCSLAVTNSLLPLSTSLLHLEIICVSTILMSSLLDSLHPSVRLLTISLYVEKTMSDFELLELLSPIQFSQLKTLYVEGLIPYSRDNEEATELRKNGLVECFKSRGIFVHFYIKDSPSNSPERIKQRDYIRRRSLGSC